LDLIATATEPEFWLKSDRNSFDLRERIADVSESSNAVTAYYVRNDGADASQLGLEAYVRPTHLSVGGGLDLLVVTDGWLLRCSRSHPNLRTALAEVLYFEGSCSGSKGSQEPNKQLTSPEVMAWSNSSD
jgi:hypothetical protein